MGKTKYLQYGIKNSWYDINQKKREQKERKRNGGWERGADEERRAWRSNMRRRHLVQWWESLLFFFFTLNASGTSCTLMWLFLYLWRCRERRSFWGLVRSGLEPNFQNKWETFWCILLTYVYLLSHYYHFTKDPLFLFFLFFLPPSGVETTFFCICKSYNFQIIVFLGCHQRPCRDMSCWGEKTIESIAPDRRRGAWDEIERGTAQVNEHDICVVLCLWAVHACWVE